jgi:hypothetical protein
MRLFDRAAANRIDRTGHPERDDLAEQYPDFGRERLAAAIRANPSGTASTSSFPTRATMLAKD